MRGFVSIGAVLVAGAIVGGDVAGFAAPNPKFLSGVVSTPGLRGITRDPLGGMLLSLEGDL